MTGNNIDITFDVEKFTIEDARQAALDLFGEQKKEFLELKNAPWYMRLLNAVTLGSSERKRIIKDISSLAKLQELFLHIYLKSFKYENEQLDQIISNIATTNDSVWKIYMRMEAGLKPQSDLGELVDFDKNILLSCVSAYHSINGHEGDFQEYRKNLALATGIGLPEGVFEPNALSSVTASDILYRCIIEMCMLDECFDDMTMPDDIYSALDYLNISVKQKEALRQQVENDVQTFGKEYLQVKYSGSDADKITDSDIDSEFQEIENKKKELEEEQERNKKQKEANDQKAKELSDKESELEKHDNALKIKNVVQRFLDKKCDGTFYINANNLSYEVKSKEARGIAKGAIAPEDILGIYISRLIEQAIVGNDIKPIGRASGLIFSTKGLYYRPHGALKGSRYMAYNNIKAVKKVPFEVIIIGKDKTKMHIDRHVTFDTDDFIDLIEEIARIV